MGSCILGQVPLMSILDPTSVVSPLGASVSSSGKWEDISWPGCQLTVQDNDRTPAERQASAGAWNPGTALVRSAGRQVGHISGSGNTAPVESGGKMHHCCPQGPQYTPPNLSRSTDASQGMREAQKRGTGGPWGGKGDDWRLEK